MNTAKVYSVKRAFSDVLGGITLIIFVGASPQIPFSGGNPYEKYFWRILFDLLEQISSTKKRPGFNLHFYIYNLKSSSAVYGLAA